jgi:AcrR family transcriptional regulator
MKTENKILASAWRIFILYGYHETTIEKNSRDAGVSKATIHYYFRTKNNLYQEIIEIIPDRILHYTDFEYPDLDLTWVLVSELRNNKTMLLEIIGNKKGKDSEEKIQELIKRSCEAHSPGEFSMRK